MGRSALTADAIRVLRSSPDVLARLETAPPQAGRVHSVFARAINLDWHDRRLLTLQGPGALAAPFAASLGRLPHADSIRPGAGVRRTRDGLALGGAVVEWHGAATVDTVMTGRAGAPPPTLSRLAGRWLGSSAPGLSSAIGRRARSRLADGLRRRDPARFLEGGLGLIGLGEGLTPAGDDALIGALAVIRRFAPTWLPDHPEVEAALGRAAATGTTAVAREFIAHALAGRFSEPLIDLMSAVSPEAGARAAARLLGAGATSGADTLLGVHLALDAL
jgi:hypothetical protein